MRCSTGYKKITGIYIGCVLIFLLLFPALEHIGVTYCYAADPEQEQQKIKESILSEFEYGEIDDSLHFSLSDFISRRRTSPKVWELSSLNTGSTIKERLPIR